MQPHDIRSFISGWLFYDKDCRNEYSATIASWIMNYPDVKTYHAFIFLALHCNKVFQLGTFETIVDLCERIAYQSFLYHGDNKIIRNRPPGRNSHWYKREISRYIMNKSNGTFVCIHKGDDYTFRFKKRVIFREYEDEIKEEFFKDIISEEEEEQKKTMEIRYKLVKNEQEKKIEKPDRLLLSKIHHLNYQRKHLSHTDQNKHINKIKNKPIW